jgi:hypothetical protein
MELSVASLFGGQNVRARVPEFGVARDAALRTTKVGRFENGHLAGHVVESRACVRPGFPN